MKTALAAAVLAIAVLAGGCAGAGTEGGPSPAPSSETSTSTPTPEPMASSAIVLHVTTVSVEDGSGAVLSSAPREDPAAVLQLVTEALGAPTTSDTTGAFGARYEWGDDVVVGTSGWAWVRFLAASSGGYDLRADDGIAVGSTRADVLALPTYDDGYDGDGDGLSDSLGLEPQPEPGTESLVHPGEVGTSYILAIFHGDTVWAVSSPAGDWMDV